MQRDFISDFQNNTSIVFIPSVIVFCFVIVLISYTFIGYVLNIFGLDFCHYTIIIYRFSSDYIIYNQSCTLDKASYFHVHKYLSFLTEVSSCPGVHSKYWSRDDKKKYKLGFITSILK